MPFNTRSYIVTVNISSEVQYDYKRVHVHFLLIFVSKNPTNIFFFSFLPVSFCCVLILFLGSVFPVSCPHCLCLPSHGLPTSPSSMHPSTFNCFIRAKGVGGWSLTQVPLSERRGWCALDVSLLHLTPIPLMCLTCV